MDFQIFSDYFQYFIISIILKNEKIFGIFWGIVKSIFTTEVKTKVAKRMNINFTSVKTDSARLFVCFFFSVATKERRRDLSQSSASVWFAGSSSRIPESLERSLASGFRSGSTQKLVPGAQAAASAIENFWRARLFSIFFTSSFRLTGGHSRQLFLLFITDENIDRVLKNRSKFFFLQFYFKLSRRQIQKHK